MTHNKVSVLDINKRTRKQILLPNCFMSQIYFFLEVGGKTLDVVVALKIPVKLCSGQISYMVCSRDKMKSKYVIIVSVILIFS